MSKKEYNSLAFLNIIRVVLAISVILWHCPFGTADVDAYPFLWGLREMTKYGGNQAFLLISGMIFCLVFYPKLIDGTLSTKSFLISRAKRIYPTVFVTTIIAYIFCVIGHYTYHPEQSIEVIPLLLDLLFFGTRLFGGYYGTYNKPIWFLSILFVCYLISLLVIVLTRKKKSVLWFLIPLFITLLAGFSSQFFVPSLGFGIIGIESSNFFLGFFFMLFLKKFDSFKLSLKITLRVSGFVVAFIFLFMFYKYKGANPLGSGEIIGSLLCWIPLFTCLYGLKVNILFDNIVFKHFAGISFHLYLWHSTCGYMWDFFFLIRGEEVWVDGWKPLLCFLSLVVLCSSITYFLFFYLNKRKAKLQHPQVAS